jgi:AraC-like DNA-binding protein
MEDQLKKLVMSLLAYAVQRDLPPDALCRLSNITMDELQKGREPLRQKQVDDLWLNVTHLSKDKLFGLHFGESLQLSALGIVGEIIKSSETVGGALTIAASLTHLITAVFHLEVIQDKTSFTVRFIPTIDDWQNSVSATQTLDLLMVFVIHELDGLMLKKIHPVAINYSGKTENIAEYERVMRCRPIINATENAIAFDQKYWSEPIITANYELQKIMLQKVPELKTDSIQKQTLQSRIYNYLLTNSYLGIVSLDDIASNFNISPRTLQRKLKEEGISFQQIADEARKTLAINYLKAGSYPVKEISCMLGYNELSAFTRTFKRWTGRAPGAYQRSL